MNKYKIIYAAYMAGNITKTAKQLNYSQSAVSQVINNYEKKLGFPIFRRSKQGITATQEGYEVLVSIRKILDEEEHIQQICEQALNPNAGVISVGTFTSMSKLVLPGLLRTFQEQYPDIRVQVISGNYLELKGMLDNGILDCAFLSEFNKGEFDFQPIMRDEYMLVFPQNHTFSSRISITINDVNNQPFIIPGESLSSELGQILKDEGVKIQVAYESSDDSTSLAMVEAGLGVTILPKLVLESESADVCSRPFREHYFRTLGIAISEFGKSNKVTSTFIEQLKQWIALNTKEHLL